MNDTTVINVAYYNEAEAKLEKTAKSYDNFTYDNEADGGILALFNDISTKIKDIKGNITSLNDDYNTLTTKYERFSNFKESMTTVINTMNTRIENIEKCYNNILTTAQQAVNDYATNDKNLIDDLDKINALLSGKSGTDAGFGKSNNLPNGYSQEEWNKLSDTEKQAALAKQQEMESKGKIETNEYKEDYVEDKFAMTGDLDKISDDIIAGKYGYGDDRFKELEKQGYNLRDVYDADGNLIARGVQDIVNEKMNGTYDPNKTASYASPSTSGQNLTDQGYPSSTDGYKPQNLTEKGYPSSTEGMNTSTNTSGQNLTDKGYPSSTEGYKPQNLTDKGYPSSTDGYNQQQSAAAKQNEQIKNFQESFTTPYITPENTKKFDFGDPAGILDIQPSTTNNSTFNPNEFITNNTLGVDINNSNQSTQDGIYQYESDPFSK